MTSILLPVLAFGCFLAIYLKQKDRHGRPTDRRQHRTVRRVALRATWEQVPSKRKREIVNTWVFALVVAPIVLVQADTTWLVRGIAFLGFMGVLLVFTIFLLWRESRL